MSNAAYRHSIVEFCGDEMGHSCGYCHSEGTSLSNGMWAYTMTVEDYQDLIDRGWRRSGQYCYKPIMNAICCPMYTIRCAAGEFKVSKSQKKILKRFNKFLAHGIIDKSLKQSILNKTEALHSAGIPDVKCSFVLENDKKMDILMTSYNELVNKDIRENKQSESGNSKIEKLDKHSTCDVNTSKSGKSHQMKAKYLRIERKKQKLRNMGLNEEEICKKLLERKKNLTIKTVEDFLNEPKPEKPAHELEIKLVRSWPMSPEFEQTYENTFELYKRYQIKVHGDSPEKLTDRQFHRFLVASPLKIRLLLVKSPEFEKTFTETASLFAKYQKAVHKESDDECNENVFSNFLVDSPLESTKHYGSYHQQYWLDGKLIAVGVIDILPKCLSSVYFLYDPEYMYLSLGTYGALREIELTRKLTSQFPDLKYYYMGFYIHSCVKMRYKAAFKPSYLLCPEVYSWHPIQSCLPKLDTSKYSRFNEDNLKEDPDSVILISDVTVLYNKIAMPYGFYADKKNCSTKEREEISKYARLVGMNCAKRMLLYRS